MSSRLQRSHSLLDDTESVATALVLAAAPLLAHHSFASYDMNKTVVLTGVVTRVNPDANHLQIFFGRMTDDRNTVEKDKDGKYIIWAVDMAGSAQSAQEGISVNAFPPGHGVQRGAASAAQWRTGGLSRRPAVQVPDERRRARAFRPRRASTAIRWRATPGSGTATCPSRESPRRRPPPPSRSVQAMSVESAATRLQEYRVEPGPAGRRLGGAHHADHPHPDDRRGVRVHPDDRTAGAGLGARGGAAVASVAPLRAVPVDRAGDHGGDRIAADPRRTGA